MKGLLVKDFELLKNQKNFFVILLVVGTCLNFSSSGTFAVGYFVFVCATFVTSTMSYDEFDNGLVFLMALPVSRKNYVESKYMFGGIIIICAWLAGAAVTVACSIAKGTGVSTDNIISMVVMMPLGLIIDAAMLPFMIKFGQEKGRYVSMGVFGAFFAVGFIVTYLYRNANADISRLFDSLKNIGYLPILAGVVVIGIVSYAVSCAVSVGIMERKKL